MKASTPQLNVKSQRTSNWACVSGTFTAAVTAAATALMSRSEEHTSELQSRSDLVCRLLLEKKKKTSTTRILNSHPTACSRSRAHFQSCLGIQNHNIHSTESALTSQGPAHTDRLAARAPHIH